MFNKFNEETKKVICDSKLEMMKLKHPYLGSEHLLLGIMKSKNVVSDILKKYNITYKLLQSEVIKLVGYGDKKSDWVLYTPVVREIFERSIDISMEENTKVSIENLFISIIEIGNGIAYRVLSSINIDIDKLYNEFIFKIPKRDKKKKTIIDEICFEFTKREIVNSFEPVVGRDKEINQVIEILSRKNKSNPLLIGDAGVGKSAIIEEISRRIVNNNVPNKLKNKRIINLDMSRAVAGTKYRGEFEEKLNKIVKAASENEDIILFIDEIHTIVGAGGAEGAIDASNILKPALARSQIKCIGATTINEYKKFIEKDKALERRFKKIIIEEPNLDQVKNIINKLKSEYENFHHVNLSQSILDSIVNLSDKYIKNYRNPDKTIDVLDEVCSHANLKDNKKINEYNNLSDKLLEITKKKKECIKYKNFKDAYKYKKIENNYITKLNELELLITTTNYINVSLDDVYEVISNRTNIPINKIKNIDDRVNLYNILSKKIIGQNNILKSILDSYSLYNSMNKPYSALFLGSTGVGKTFTALEFAKNISKNVIRIDLREYNDSYSINKLVGAPPGYIGYDNNNYLLDSVRENPLSVIIFDGLEFCHSYVQNLILQILDNGEIKDSKGNNIHFNNSIIILISNYLDNSDIGFKKGSKVSDNFTKIYNDKVTETFVFNKLTKENICEIINSKVNDKSQINNILCKSDYEKLGAKKINNLIEKYKKVKKIKKISKNYSKN